MSLPLATVALGGGVGGVSPPTAFHVWSFRWTLTEKSWEGPFSQRGQDLGLDSTVGLREALASACHGEAPKLPPPSRLGKEKGGPEVAGRLTAQGSLVVCRGNCRQTLSATSGGSAWGGGQSVVH